MQTASPYGMACPRSRHQRQLQTLHVDFAIHAMVTALVAQLVDFRLLMPTYFLSPFLGHTSTGTRVMLLFRTSTTLLRALRLLRLLRGAAAVAMCAFVASQMKTWPSRAILATTTFASDAIPSARRQMSMALTCPNCKSQWRCENVVPECPPSQLKLTVINCGQQLVTFLLHPGAFSILPGQSVVKPPPTRMTLTQSRLRLRLRSPSSERLRR